MSSPVRALAVTGTRADFGLWEPIMRAAAEKESGLRVSLLVTAMHLDPRFGLTAAEVRASGYEIAAEVASTPAGDSRGEMAGAIGAAITGMITPIERLRPDWLCLLGDRGEQLAAALVGLHLGLPMAHLHGGERTLGAVDDAIRDMISRVSHLHLVANRQAADRLIGIGEAPWRITVTGAPGIDSVAGRDGSADADVRARYGLPDTGYLVLLEHPETAGGSDPLQVLDATLEGIARSMVPVAVISPNADAGGRAMLARLTERQATFLGLWSSLPHDDYLAVLTGAVALIGNSSSGLIEAPALGVPAINVGERQDGRTRGDNVIDVPADPMAIAAAIRRAMSVEFKGSLSRRSPYGSGDTAQAVIKALVTTPIDGRLMRKEAPE